MRDQRYITPMISWKLLDAWLPGHGMNEFLSFTYNTTVNQAIRMSRIQPDGIYMNEFPRRRKILLFRNILQMRFMTLR